MSGASPGFVNLEGVDYRGLIDLLSRSELTGLSYDDLVGYLQRDLQFGLDGMPVQSNVKPTDGSLLRWSNSRGAWIQAGTPGYATATASAAPGALSSSTEAVLVTASITIANPAGAKVAVRGGASAFATTAPARVNLNLQTDTLGWGLAAWLYFNNATQHLWCGDFETEIGPLAAGAHTIELGATVQAGAASMDGNDRAYLTVQELL